MTVVALKSRKSVRPCDVGQIEDDLCDIANLADGGIDACFGLEHVSGVQCEGQRAIFEAIIRRVREIQEYTGHAADRMGKVQS